MQEKGSGEFSKNSVKKNYKKASGSKFWASYLSLGSLEKIKKP